MGGVPSVPADPSRKVQAISAGFSRTGTLSMSLALEKLLDGPVCHGGSQMFGREDEYIKKWIDIYRYRHDKPRLMKKLADATRGFVAITDAPGNQFILELQELYPDANVIDVHRDIAKWSVSHDSIVQHTSSWWLRYFLAPMPGWRWIPTLFDYMDERSFELMDGREVESPGKNISDEKYCPWQSANLTTGYEELLEYHHQYVRDVVSKDKLFTIQLTDGWDPLCKILNKPLPSEPFPWANDQSAIDRLVKTIKMKTALVWLCILMSITLGMLGLSKVIFISMNTSR